jgi:hypothetical protein
VIGFARAVAGLFCHAWGVREEVVEDPQLRPSGCRPGEQPGPGPRHRLPATGSDGTSAVILWQPTRRNPAAPSRHPPANQPGDTRLSMTVTT